MMTEMIPNTAVAWQESLFVLTRAAKVICFDLRTCEQKWISEPLADEAVYEASVELATLPSGSSIELHASYFPATTVCICMGGHEFVALDTNTGARVFTANLDHDLGLQWLEGGLLVLQQMAVLVCQDNISSFV
jgi:glucose dehydrogenase